MAADISLDGVCILAHSLEPPATCSRTGTVRGFACSYLALLASYHCPKALAIRTVRHFRYQSSASKPALLLVGVKSHLFFL